MLRALRNHRSSGQYFPLSATGSRGLSASLLVGFRRFTAIQIVSLAWSYFYFIYCQWLNFSPAYSLLRPSIGRNPFNHQRTVGRLLLGEQPPVRRIRLEESLACFRWGLEWSCFWVSKPIPDPPPLREVLTQIQEEWLPYINLGELTHQGLVSIPGFLFSCFLPVRITQEKR